MKDFDIVKYLKENKQGAYGMFNGYVDLKPLKEEEENIPAEDNSDLDADTVPYEGADDMITGNGEDDTYEQDDIVSEGEEEDPDYDRMMDLGGEHIEQGIISLLDDGFPEEDILFICQEFIGAHSRAKDAYKNDDQEFEAPEWQQDRTQNREFYEGKEGDIKKHIFKAVSKLDALAKEYGFQMQGSVNQNPKGVDDTIARWKDTTPGYQRQFVDLYMENGELWVNWGSFRYNEKYADGSGNDPVRELFKEKSWKNFFGTLERRKNREI